MKQNKIAEACVTTIRTLAMDAVQKANSGHPGTPMALAPVGYLLYDRILRHNPANPLWPNRDRFVLSAGHASMLQYSVLHLCGYPISLEDLRSFRQWGSICAGHPEYEPEKGIEITTGPLGQGAATSVGMAIAQTWLAARYNKPGFPLFDYRIFALLSDGCMMEGVTAEAASLAGHLGLDNLIWIYDDNRITIEGDTALAFSDDVKSRFQAHGWAVFSVPDVNAIEDLEDAIRRAESTRGKPALVVVRSHIAFGSPNKQDTAEAHGTPLGEEEIRATKINYGWNPDKKFYVPQQLSEFKNNLLKRGQQLEAEWQILWRNYQNKYADLAAEVRQILEGSLPTGWNAPFPSFSPDEKGKATRQINHVMLNEAAKRIPWFLGGSADLAPSNKTELKEAGHYSKDNRGGRNFHFGIREHAMAAIGNGLALSGLRPFVATFFVFSDYLRPALRLSALMKLPVLYIFTHDSIGVGEDGPTHQPIEHLPSLRAMPNLEVIRPADANELSVLWTHILSVTDHPIALVLTRQAVPILDRDEVAAAEGALKGAYILKENSPEPEIVLVASGSEVSLCLAAFQQLSGRGAKVRVVSMPSWRLFEQQPEEYRKSVFPDSQMVLCFAVEAASPFGWERYTGDSKNILGLNRFGASAPAKELFRHFHLTAEDIVNKVMHRLDEKRKELHER